MRKVTNKQIDAFVLVKVQKRTHAQAAEKLGISRSSVTRRILRFLSHIK